ncbi:MAG: glycosyltransferase family 2 protein [Gammaproteobacteria bacterium]
MANRSSQKINSISVSVVLATYNRAHYLPQALDSLLHQTRPPDEIIVVDDGSTDETAEVAEHHNKQIRYYRTENRGKSSALNLGIPLAQSSHIWIFDDDDVALPDALQSHIDFLTIHSETDFSYSTNYVYSGASDIWQRDKWSLKTIPAWPADMFLIRSMEGINTLLQGMLIPKRCFAEVGPFNPTLLRAQDSEMLLRLAQRFRALNIQKPTFVLREHPGPRGSTIKVHNARQRSAIQLQYQQRIFRLARDECPLAIYLPHEPGTGLPILTDTEHGLALLQRSCIMFRQGLANEAMTDMKDGLVRLNEIELHTSQVKSILSKALDIDPWRLSRPYHLILKLSLTLKATSAEALAPSIARGIFWTLQRSLHTHQWRAAMRSATMLCLSVLLNAGSFSHALMRSSSSRIDAS